MRSPVIPRCTVQRHNGSFCDAPMGADMPFPICGRHASQLFIRMRELVAEFNGDPMRRMMVAFDDLDVERARKATPPKAYVVYYLLVGDLLKIGTTGDLAGRLKTYPPHRKLLATEPGGVSLESRRHAQFKDLLDAGREWFRFEGDLVAHVEGLRDAQIPKINQS